MLRLDSGVPLDTVLKAIRRQTLRWSHWGWGSTRTIRLQPEPDLPRGWIYNLTLTFRWITGLGCHR